MEIQLSDTYYYKSYLKMLAFEITSSSSDDKEGEYRRGGRHTELLKRRCITSSAEAGPAALATAPILMTV